MSQDNRDDAVQPGLISSKPIWKGRIIDLSLDDVRFPDGSVGQLELVRHIGASAVLPILSEPGGEDPQILLIRQYRYASGGYMLEIPAGLRNADEDPEICARRELEEETGLAAGSLQFLTTIFTTPGFTDERIHIYMATGLTEGTAKLDVDEFLSTVVMPISEALQLVRSGEINDAKTMCAILFAAGFLLGA